MIKNKKKGSTLVLVLMFLSILMIIGTSIMALAVSNYKMRNLRGDATRAFYQAESGIEQGYSIVRDVIEEAKVKEDSSEIKSYIKDNLKLENNKINTSSEDNKESYDKLFGGNLEVKVIEASGFANAYDNVYIIKINSTSKYNNIKKIITADYRISYVDQSNIDIEIVNFQAQ